MRGGECIKEKEQLIPQMKLLTPLFGSFYPDDRQKDAGHYDENRTQAELLDGKDLAPYEAVIAQMVEKENAFREEGVCNLMDYFHGRESIKQKVSQAIVSVQQVDGELYGCTTLTLRANLEGSELKELCDYINGQYSDGWGEGFEQRDIAIDGGVLNVHFWSSGGLQFQKKQIVEEKREMEQRPEHGEGKATRPKLKFIGKDGNIFAILGRAKAALCDAGMREEASEMISRVTEAGSYEQALRIVSAYVEKELSPAKEQMPDKKSKKKNQPER